MQNDEQIYLKYLKSKYSNEASKVLLLKVMAVCGSLFRWISDGMYAPLGLVVESENMMQSVVDDLAGFFPADIYSLSILPKEMKKVLADREREVIFFRYSRLKKAKENMEMLVEFCQECREKTVIILFINIIPDEIRPYLTGQIRVENCCNLKNPHTEEKFLRFLIEFIIKNFEYIKNVNSSLPFPESEDWLKESEGLRAVSKAYQLLEEVGRYLYLEEEYFTSLSNAASQIMLEWQGDLTKNEISDWFLRSFRNAAGQVQNVYERHEPISLEIIENKNMVIYDNNIYYLTEDLFYRVCKKMLDIISINALKEKLTEAGILLSEGGGRTYSTRKVLLYLTNGTAIRKRRICLNRAAVDRAYTFSWLETVQINLKEKEGDDCNERGWSTTGILPGSEELS